MKKVLLLILGISFFTFTSKAQSSWKNIFAEGDVTIEMKTEDCNLSNRLVPNTFALLRYTNKSNKDITFNFEMKLWYNDVLQDNTPVDLGDPAIIKTIQLSANSSITGECTSKEEYLKVFYKHNNPKMDIQLTNIEFKAK